MYALRLAATQSTGKYIVSTANRRTLSSSTSAAIEKLRFAFEEYRLQHYTQEMPMRFKKDIVRAATKGNPNSDDYVAMEGLQRVLVNIAATDRISSAEVKAIFDELGHGNGKLQAKTILQII